MPDLVIRDVAAEDVDQLRSGAADQGTSLQRYLRDAVHGQAAYLRRQSVLAAAAERLRGRPHVPADERRAVLDALGDPHAECAE